MYVIHFVNLSNTFFTKQIFLVPFIKNIIVLSREVYISFFRKVYRPNRKVKFFMSSDGAMLTCSHHP